MSFWDIQSIFQDTKPLFLAPPPPLFGLPTVGEVGFHTYFSAAVYAVYGNSFPGKSIPHSQIDGCPERKNTLTAAPPCGKGVFLLGDGKEKTSPRSDLTSFRSSFSRVTKTCTLFAPSRTPAGPVAWTRTTPDGIKKKKPAPSSAFLWHGSCGADCFTSGTNTQVRLLFINQFHGVETGENGVAAGFPLI